MEINVFSFFMAVIWSSVAILTLYFGRKRRNFIRNFGITNLLIIYAICAARLLLPIELPYTKIINISGVFASIYEITCLEKIQIFGLSTTIMYIMLAIWMASAIFLIIRWIVRYQKALLCLNRWKDCRDFHAEQILKRIKSLYGRDLEVEVWRTSQIEIPMGVGVIRRMILLPRVECTEEELYYILLHEYTHFINRDIEIKTLSHIFCCIFWWNPVVYFLKKDLDQTLEIKCDLTITRTMDKKEAASYLGVIVAVIKNTGKKRKIEQNVISTMLFQPKMDVIIIERFQIVIDEYMENKKKTALYYGCIVLLCGIMGLSYLFQFQAGFPSPPLEEGEEMTPENTYLIDNKNGTYTVVDMEGKSKDSIVDKMWIIEDMIRQGFPVK